MPYRYSWTVTISRYITLLVMLAWHNKSLEKLLFLTTVLRILEPLAKILSAIVQQKTLSQTLRLMEAAVQHSWKTTCSLAQTYLAIVHGNILVANKQ